MKLRDRVYKKFGGKCAYCGWMLTDWQVDHVVSKAYWFFLDPHDMDEVNRFENLYPACKICNHYKRSHCLDSFYSHIGFRDYMLKFHIRLGKLPKKTKRAKTEKRIAYMQEIANRYNITPTQPFSGKFYFEMFNNDQMTNGQEKPDSSTSAGNQNAEGKQK